MVVDTNNVNGTKDEDDIPEPPVDASDDERFDWEFRIGKYTPREVLLDEIGHLNDHKRPRTGRPRVRASRRSL